MLSSRVLLWICALCCTVNFWTHARGFNEHALRSQWREDDSDAMLAPLAKRLVNYLRRQENAPFIAIQPPKYQSPIDEQKRREPSNDLAEIVIESDGYEFENEVTIKMSLPVTVDFVWILSNARKETVYTRGKYETTSSTVFTWLTMTAIEVALYNIQMRVTTAEETFIIQLNEKALQIPGEMRLDVKDPVLYAPAELTMGEDGSASFATDLSQTSLASSTSIIGAVDTYLDTSSSQPIVVKEPVYGTISRESMPAESQSTDVITLQLGPDAQQFSGVVTLPKSDIQLGAIDDPNYIDRIVAYNTIQVYPFDSPSSDAKDGVAFEEFKMAAMTEWTPSSLSHGSVSCSAVGSQRPDVKILRDGEEVETFSLGDDGVKQRVVYQLDGKQLQDVEGVYTCVATCGHVVIDSEIMVQAGDGDVIWWPLS